jgi:aspartate-semialdehyde dehydrogenase
VDRFRVGVLGATGLVGQRLAERLSAHPWFEIAALAASERSAGRPYGEVVRWTLSADPPEELARMVVRPCDPSALEDCDLVFSGLDAAAAREIEPGFSRAGFPVVSNSSALRLNADVPIVVPEVNASHLAIVEKRLPRGNGGFVVTNPNCSVAGLVIALAPLHRARTVTRVVVATQSK